MKHCRRAAQGREKDAPSLQSNVLLLVFPLGKPSKQAAMTGGHIPLLEPQMDEHLLGSLQSKESLRSCPSSSARPGSHPLRHRRRIHTASAGDATGFMLQALQAFWLVWMSFQLDHELLPPGHQRGGNLQNGEEKER